MALKWFCTCKMTQILKCAAVFEFLHAKSKNVQMCKMPMRSASKFICTNTSFK